VFPNSDTVCWFRNLYRLSKKYELDVRQTIPPPTNIDFVLWLDVWLWPHDCLVHIDLSSGAIYRVLCCTKYITMHSPCIWPWRPWADSCLSSTVVRFKSLGGLNDRRGLEPVNKCSQSSNSSWFWIIAIRLGRGLERVSQYGNKGIKCMSTTRLLITVMSVCVYVCMYTGMKQWNTN
jgi:hypothetical protein